MPFLRRFARARDGNVAVIFGVSILPVLAALGVAIDYSRAKTALAQLQAGTDASALALCKSGIAAGDMQRAAQDMIASYVADGAVTVDAPSVTTLPRTVSLTAHASVAPGFARIMTAESIGLTAHAGCSASETSYEIALVLDTTGSMASSSGSTSKIQALRATATTFVNYIFDRVDTSHVKMAIVPFAAAVKVDPAAYATSAWLDKTGHSSLHWQNIKGATAAGFTSRLDVFAKLARKSDDWAWAGCLESLPYPLNVQDGAPSASNPDSYYVPLLAPDEVNASTNSNLSSNNSYIDDGTATTGSCDSNSGTDATRMSQACKYASPKNARTSQPGPNWMCTARALTRLTSDRSKLLSEISQLQASGNTDIHEGFMWGWRTLSPTSIFADGAPYVSTDPVKKTVKIIVLMTDGVNTWTTDTKNAVTGSYYSAYGYFKNADGSDATKRLPTGTATPTSDATARAAMDALTRSACTNAAKAGVTVYTVGFSVASDPIDTQGQTLLADCAGSGSRAFIANDATGLTGAFSSIAEGIGQLRLTQ